MRPNREIDCSADTYQQSFECRASNARSPGSVRVVTITEGDPGSNPAAAGLSARLRASVFNAHAEAVQAADTAAARGRSVNRDLVELLALQRCIISIAEQFDHVDFSTAPSVSEPSFIGPGSAASGADRRADARYDIIELPRSIGGGCGAGTPDPAVGPTPSPSLTPPAGRSGWPVTLFRWEKEAFTSGVTVARGNTMSLSKQTPNLTRVAVGVGWDVHANTGADFDLDASALACGANQKVLSDQHFVFYNNLRSPEGNIEHTGDNPTWEGDDEVINVDLAATPPTITNIFFLVSMHEADTRGQSFGQVRNAYIRVMDRSTGAELARFDLTDNASTDTAMVFGELYRHGDEWKFRAIGQGYASGLAGIARGYGVNV